MAVPLKLVNFAGAWQVSHAVAPLGMWVGGGVTTVTP
jgi:predicted membrane-bound mannosyltransferase